MLGATHRPAARLTRLNFFTLGAVALLLLLSATAVSARQAGVGGARSPIAKKRPAGEALTVQEKIARGEAPLSRLYDFIRVESSARHWLPPLAESERPTTGPEKKRQIGVVRSFPTALDALSDSTAYSVSEGEVRVMGVVTEGALSTRVRFEKVALPPGARLFVYSLRNPDEVYGPYEGRGPSKDGSFWTPPMEGDGVGIDYFAPGTAEGAAPFRVTEVSHIYADPLSEPNSPAGSCNREVTAEYANAAKAVGHLQFTDGGEFICTGTLLNSTSNSFIPYLITANHCFDTQSVAQTLRVYWNYNTGDFPPPGTPRTDGATLLATNPSSDFTFVRLTGNVPGGLWFTGWTPTMPAVGDPVTGIHHPSGSHKRQSFGSRQSQTCPSFLTGPCGNFLRVIWSLGTTEGGSSGSELLVGPAADPRYVGNLLGGDALCTNQGGSDYYGAFSATYPFVRSFLEDEGNAGSTVGLYNPFESAFFLRNANSGGGANAVFFYGPAAGWRPIAGDWNGDGADTAGLYNPSTGTFFLRNSNSGGSADVVFSYGPAGAGWVPVVGDWDGNGVDTVGLYNPSAGAFFLRNSNSAGPADLVFFYGPAQWTPIAGDWNGDGVDTVGLYSPNGAFFLRNSNSAGPADAVFFYGPAGAGWIPLAGDWNNDGVSTVGMYSPSNSAFFLRNSNSAGPADASFFYGPAGAGWIPVAGDWNGQ